MVNLEIVLIMGQHNCTHEQALRVYRFRRRMAARAAS